MIFGGSPHIVADPPRFAQKISDRISGIGLKSRSCASSTVTAAKNRITVILSMNIARTNDMIMNVINIGMTLYRTAFAIVIHSQRKKPAFAIPSTITIIPARKMIVAQLIPPVLSDEAPASYQNESVKMFLIFNVSSIASMLCIATPNTRTSVASPHTNVIT